MSRPFNSRQSHPPGYFIRTNERIRVPEVRVVTNDGKQLGVHPTRVAIQMARDHGMDLVEIAATASPPVCRIVNFGKYKYELAKKESEVKKHQHVMKVKEIQLRPFTDPHDFEHRLQHAIEFLNGGDKVRVSLRFRGRENAHQEFGHQTMGKFVNELVAYGKSDGAPRKVGRGITVLITPIPPSQRAKPNASANAKPETANPAAPPRPERANGTAASGLNTPFANLSVPATKPKAPGA